LSTFLLGDKVFKCTKPEEQTIDVKCPPGTVIRINEAIYGVNQYNLCLYTNGDCIEHVNLDNECCGHNYCNVTYWKVYSVKCLGGSFVSFFRLIYDCIPREFLILISHYFQFLLTFKQFVY